MFHLLEKLRTKSRAQRTFIAFTISLLFTGVLFVMWLAVEQNPEGVETPKVVKEHTPTDTLFKNIGDIWGSMVNGAKNARETVKTFDVSSTIEYESVTPTTPSTATTP